MCIVLPVPNNNYIVSCVNTIMLLGVKYIYCQVHYTYILYLEFVSGHFAVPGTSSSFLTRAVVTSTYCNVHIFRCDRKMEHPEEPTWTREEHAERFQSEPSNIKNPGPSQHWGPIRPQIVVAAVALKLYRHAQIQRLPACGVLSQACPNMECVKHTETEKS